MAHPAFDRLHEQKLRSRAEAEAWETLCNLLEEHPTLFQRLEAILLDPKSNGTPSPALISPSRKPEHPNWYRVWKYLMANGNRGITIRQIREGTGMKNNAVTWSLYTCGHKYLFDKRRNSEKGKRGTMWLVKPDYTSADSLPPVEDDPEEETRAPQEDVPATKPIVVEAPKPKPKPKPKLVGPRPKHAPAGWGQPKVSPA